MPTAVVADEAIAVWMVFRVGAVALGLYAFHRLLFWLESRGYVYYRNVKPKPGAVRSAALEAERLMGRPSVEHRIEAEDARVEKANDDGQ